MAGRLVPRHGRSVGSTSAGEVRRPARGHADASGVTDRRADQCDGGADVVLSHRAVHLAGRVPLYYEDIDPGHGRRPPIVVVHGGGFTGSCYLSTPDGRAGWAYDFLRHGYRVIVPDWPGVGRSAAFPSNDVTGEVVAEALGALLVHLGTPVVLLV